jgi:hypothetical protein
MSKTNFAKIFFFISVLLFVAKPFLGFGMFNRMHPPPVQNIFVKSFTKRKAEFHEDKFSISAIQKKLAEPLKVQHLLFGLLLSILFPTAFALRNSITGGILNQIQLSLIPSQPAWLLNGKLTI